MPPTLLLQYYFSHFYPKFGRANFTLPSHYAITNHILGKFKMCEHNTENGAHTIERDYVLT